MDKTVIFDLDGTLADTRKITAPALRRVAREVGLEEPSDGLVSQAIGVSGDAFYRIVYPAAAARDLPELAARVFAIEKEIAASLGKELLFWCVPEMLSGLEARGMRLVIASTGEVEHVESVLRVTGLAGRFADIRCGHNDKAAMLRELIAERGAGARFVMVGDKPKDCDAARENGLDSIGAGWGFSTPGELSGFTLTARNPTNVAITAELLLVAAGFAEGPENLIPAESVFDPALAGTRIFERPILGVGDTSDVLFDRLRAPEAIGPHVLTPRELMHGARSVVSLFFPFTEAVRVSNRRGAEPSAAWLHGRIEGQAALTSFMRSAAAAMNAAPDSTDLAMVPALDPRVSAGDYGPFTSRWSERHVAHICGLGTFGLSGGLITRRGMAGRLASLLTMADLVPTPRDYAGLMDWCARCKACARRCPASAITEERKEHAPCSDYLDEIRRRHAPYYGCGKCQTGVPCEARRPV